MIMEHIDELTKLVINSSYKVHNKLGAGFLEKIYERALSIELKKSGLKVENQYPIAVFYEGTNIGEYFADLFIQNRLIVELKSVENLSTAHEKQLVNYLTATDIEDGLLINFGSGSVQVKRKFKTYRRL